MSEKLHADSMVRDTPKIHLEEERDISIKVQPSDVISKIGAFINIAAVARGSQLSFQWFNQYGQQIPNKNKSNLFIGPVKEEDFGFFRLEILSFLTGRKILTRWVEIKKEGGDIFADGATQLTTGTKPQVMVQPQGGTFRDGSSFELTGFFQNVKAHQWYKDGNKLEGCTGNSLKITQCNWDNNGLYKLAALNEFGIETTKDIQVIIQ